MRSNQTELVVKEVSESGLFKGYASVFNIIDAHKEAMLPGSFSNSLRKWQRAGNMPKMLWQHDNTKPIGIWLQIEEDDKGLYVTGQILRCLKRGDEVYHLLKNGVIDSLSIGFLPRQSHQDSSNTLRYHSDVDLVEISLVTYPANPQARILNVKSHIMRCLNTCKNLKKILTPPLTGTKNNV